METLPILLVHTGNPYYLRPILKQARFFNPNNRLCLISDASTRGIPEAEHFMIDDYASSAREFEKVYQHLSINTRQFELFCFQRWFYIKEFAASQGFSHFLCIDSDFLLFEQVDRFFSGYEGYDYTVCGESGPICTLFNTESIERFCRFCLELYTVPQYLSSLQETYRDMVSRHQIGGICDMTAFKWYKKYVSDNVIDIAIPHNGVCMDHRIRSSFGFEMDETHPDLLGNIAKKIYWKDDRPYGKYLATGELVRFAGIHLQGGAKRMLPYFLLDAKGKHRQGFFHVLKWNLKPAVLKHTLKKASEWYLNREVLKRKLLFREKQS